MFRRILLVVVLVVLGLPTQVQSADPAAGWRGVKVFPRVDAVVKVGNKTIEDAGIGVPWIVQEVKGEWLWISSRASNGKGWVQKRQVVTLDEAPAYYTGLITSNRQKAWAYSHRAMAWKEKGELDLAIADYGERLRLNPDAFAYQNRANGYERKKEYEKATSDYNEALRLAPNFSLACNNFAWLLATCPDARYRNGKRAVELATKACDLNDWKDWGWIDTLAAAYAETGDFSSAIKYENKAIALAPNKAEPRASLKLFQSGKPIRN